MGANLICYICIGPKEYGETEKKKAYDVLAGYREKAKFLESKVDEWEMLHHPECKAWLEEQKDISCVVENWRDYGSDHIEDLVVFLDAPDCVLDRFFQAWEGGARDMAVRSYPDNDDEVIVVAGDMSWGDTPQGIGYQALNDIHRYDLLDVLEIH